MKALEAFVIVVLAAAAAEVVAHFIIKKLDPGGA
jgi:hypothetical protein